MQLQFDNIVLNVRPHQVHEWAITTAEVAQGYGITPDAIRMHKSRNADELVEGKHFVSVTNSYAVGNQAETWWTKRGVIRLGFLIKSERAKRFRDWAEDLIVKVTESQQPAPSYQIEDPIARAQRWIEEQHEKKAIEAENEALRPKAAYAESVLSSETELTTTVIAKELGMSAIALNKKLHSARIQWKQRNVWVLYAHYENKGYAVMKTHPYFDSEGKPQTNHYLVWTEKGRQFIHSKINPAYRTTPAMNPALSAVA